MLHSSLRSHNQEWSSKRKWSECVRVICKVELGLWIGVREGCSNLWILSNRKGKEQWKSIENDGTKEDWKAVKKWKKEKNRLFENKPWLLQYNDKSALQNEQELFGSPFKKKTKPPRRCRSKKTQQMCSQTTQMKETAEISSAWNWLVCENLTSHTTSLQLFLLRLFLFFSFRVRSERNMATSNQKDKEEAEKFMGRFTISSSQPKSALSSWSTRAWGRKMFFTSGTTYLTGVFSGGIIGAIEGLRKADHSLGWRLRVNSVMNGATRRGSKSGNMLGVYGLSLALLRQIHCFRSCFLSRTGLAIPLGMWILESFTEVDTHRKYLGATSGVGFVIGFLFRTGHVLSLLFCLILSLPFSSSFQERTPGSLVSICLLSLFSTFCCVLSLTSPWMPSSIFVSSSFHASALGSFICPLGLFGYPCCFHYPDSTIRQRSIAGMLCALGSAAFASSYVYTSDHWDRIEALVPGAKFLNNTNWRRPESARQAEWKLKQTRQAADAVLAPPTKPTDRQDSKNKEKWEEDLGEQEFQATATASCLWEE